MARNVYRFKGNFKSFLFVLAVLITLASLYYTNTLVKELQMQSREFLRFKVEVFEKNINSEESADLNFFFTRVIQAADYPIIYTDANLAPLFWKNINIPSPGNPRDISPDTLKMILDLMEEFRQENPPIPISFQGNVLGYYFYGPSPIIQKLRLLPIIQIIVVAMFVLIGYAGFSSIKKNEERFIWVGMAKETAHQLGTPLSSQIGWLEYLKAEPDQLPKVLPELEKDLRRLQVITNRFSQIGSLPDMKQERLPEIIDDIVSYFRSRIPHKNGKVRLEVEHHPGVSLVTLNADLFSWVLENLIKNALDALENKGGVIRIKTGMVGEKRIFIDICDNGKGISGKDRKDVFKPGFSTKKRGWGLGLSLAKRIIEEYHGGKIYLKESSSGKGSTFRIVLKNR